MLTPVAPSTSNINDRLQCRRHLKAEDARVASYGLASHPILSRRSLWRRRTSKAPNRGLLLDETGSKQRKSGTDRHEQT